MAMLTSPGYLHVECEECENIIDIPIHLSAELDSSGYVIVKYKGTDLQPIYNHRFEFHMNLPLIEE